MSNLVYFSFIPIIIMFFLWVTFEIIDKKFYIKIKFKNHIYLFGSIITALICTILVILSIYL